MAAPPRPAATGPVAALVRHWVIAAAYLAGILALLAPLVYLGWGWQILLIHLCGVAYAIHQIEEHWDDRFRAFVNQRMFGGVEALSLNAVWWINVPGVWGINIAALYGAIMGSPADGLVAPYLMLVNAVGHGAGAIRFGYNPGLATSVLLFAPIGLAAVMMIPAALVAHGIGLGIAIAIHLAIIGFVLPRAWRSGGKVRA
ncbi:MAG: HXXEE domain-containing protein [Sphingomonas sp.]|nr:HXXEE domain-containing protein [Sphingomonas sp.]